MRAQEAVFVYVWQCACELVGLCVQGLGFSVPGFGFRVEGEEEKKGRGKKIREEETPRKGKRSRAHEVVHEKHKVYCTLKQGHNFLKLQHFKGKCREGGL